MCVEARFFSNSSIVSKFDHDIFHYVFDYEKFFPLFERNILKKVHFLTFQEAHRYLSGASILEISGIDAKRIGVLNRYIDTSQVRVNASMSPEVIEYYYLCSFLSAQPTTEFFNENKQFLAPIINTRLKRVLNSKEKFFKLFHERFKETDFILE